jgi:hypothetical protein
MYEIIVIVYMLITFFYTLYWTYALNKFEGEEKETQRKLMLLSYSHEMKHDFTALDSEREDSASIGVDPTKKKEAKRVEKDKAHYAEAMAIL